MKVRARIASMFCIVCFICITLILCMNSVRTLATIMTIIRDMEKRFSSFRANCADTQPDMQSFRYSPGVWPLIRRNAREKFGLCP